MFEEPIELSKAVTVFALKSPTLPPATTTNLVVIGTPKPLLVDPATNDSDEQERFDNWLQKNKIEPEAIFLTHHHNDHVGDAQRLAKRFSLPIWAHKETGSRVSLPIDREIGDGEILGTCQAVHTPGHAAGHLCLLETESKTLVAGDMVASMGTILIDPTEGHMATYLDSLRRLLSLDFETVVPAHGRPITNGRAKIQDTLNHRLVRQEQILTEITKSKCEPIQLVERLYRGTPRAMFPLAERSVLSALQMLIEEGKAQTDGQIYWSI